MALAAFNKVSRTTGMGQAGGVDKGVPRNEWVCEHVTAVPSGRVLTEPCKMPGSPPNPLVRRYLPFNDLTEEYEESVTTRRHLHDSHMYVPVPDPTDTTTVIIMSIPEHELHYGSTAGIPDPGSLHIVTAFVAADDAAELVHYLNTGYRLFGNEDPDLVLDGYAEVIPGWAQGLTVFNRPLILRTLSPEGKLFWCTVTIDFSNVPDEAMVLFLDIGAPTGDWALSHAPPAAQGVDLDTDLSFTVIRPGAAHIHWHSRVTMLDDRLPAAALPMTVRNFIDAVAGGLSDQYVLCCRDGQDERHPQARWMGQRGDGS